jgi:hypothetical protein
MLTQGGLFSLGDRDLIRGGEARLDAQIGPFDPRVPRGVEVLRFLSAAIHQNGELVLSSIARTYLPKDSGIDVTEGRGPVAVDVALLGGVVQPTSRVTFRTEDVEAKAPSVAIRTDLSLAARVDSAAERSAVVLEMTLEHATGTPLDVRGARAMVDLGNVDLVAPFVLAKASVAVTSAHSPDLRAWQRFAPENASFDGGSATVAARGELHDGALEGRIDLGLDKARMTIDTFSFAASGKAWSNVVSEDIDRAVTFPGSGVDLRDVALRMESARTAGLWVRSRFVNATLTTTKALGFDTDIGVDSGPGDRTLELFTRLAKLPDVAADATSGTQLAASLHLRVRPSLLALTVQKANNGALETRGRIQKRTGAPLGGALLLSVGPFHAGLHFHDGSVTVVPLVGGAWLAEKLEEH